MRMTRAQAAAMAAAAEVDDDNDNHRNASTTPTDEGPSKEREVLGESAPNLDGEAGQSTVQDGGQEIDDEAAEFRHGEGDAAEHKADEVEEKVDGAEGDRASASTPAPSAPTEKPNHMPIHQDDSLKLDAGSPTTELPLLNITPQRTPAKNVMKHEFAHMRSTSNKENMVPDSPVVAGPVDRLQTHVEYLGTDQDQPQAPTETQHNHQPQTGHEQSNGHDDDQRIEDAPQKEPEISQTDEAQDDSLVDHFEALQVSPKKTQKFIDTEVESESQPSAEQSVPEKSALAQEDTETNRTTAESTEDVKQEASDGPKPSVNNKVQSHSKPKAPASHDKSKASASPAAKKSSSRASQPDTTKPAPKPSVRQSTVNRQSSVVRKPMAPRPELSTSPAIKRTTSVKRSSVRPSMAPRAGSSQSTSHAPAAIPHSKPRPISMSFPTPPPPPKSSKAPTQATFQLGGEAVAARLKAEKEERLKRQAEGTATKPAYQPPPPPKSTKAPTRATFQLPGEAIAAKLKAEKEERLKRAQENGGAMERKAFVPPVAAKSTKPVTKATFQLSSDAFAAKMKLQKEERLKRTQEEDAKKANEKHVFKARPAPKIKEPALVRQTAASRARLPSNETTTGGLKRATSVKDSTTTAQQKRMSAFVPSASTSAALPPRASTSVNKRQSTLPSVSKGKEVFGRAAGKKEKEDKEKKEKEEAAKKARVEAAERDRVKSREWAARRKSKVSGAPAASAAV